MDSEIITGAGSGIVGAISGGWIFKFMFQRFFDRSNGDHDKLILAEEKIKRCEKDLDALHAKIRYIQSKERL